MDRNSSETQKIQNVKKTEAVDAKGVLLAVRAALAEKGLNPVTQLLGYMLSGEPTYITSYHNARGLICKLERDELLEEIITFYLDHNV